MTAPHSVSIHGAKVEVTSKQVCIVNSLLAQSLGQPEIEAFAPEEISQVALKPATPAAFGWLDITHGDTLTRLRLAPGTSAQALESLISAARNGEISESGQAIAGLDFVALDVETANDNWGSICQIGVVRYRDGLETESKQWLCSPPRGIDHFLDVNISIHGITPADVSSAPAFAEIFPDVLEFLGSDAMVAHNVQFDATALRLATQASGTAVPDLNLACSLALARDASKSGILKVDNHKLPTVASAVGAESFPHHQALADARAAGTIIVELARRHGYSGSLEGLFASREFVLGKLNNNSLMPVLRKSTAPRTEQDLGAGTDFRTPANFGLEASAPASASASAPASEGKPTARKSRGPAPWAGVATPNSVPEANEAADPSGELFGQIVTLTGDFEPFDKGQLWDAIAEKGGTVAKSVTKKTTVVVIGTWASVTSKEKRAKELIAQGQEIQLWDQNKLLRVLGLDEEPPF